MGNVAEKLPTVVREKCGTTAGYGAHRYYKEIPCHFCSEKMKAYNANYRSGNRERIKILSDLWNESNPEKVKASKVKWNTNNPEKFKNAVKRWQVSNPAKMKISQATYRITHREKRNAYSAKYLAEHPEKFREINRRRRARRKGNGYEPYTEAQVLVIYGTDCHICHEPIDLKAPRHANRGKGWERGLHIDHKVAITNGGRDDLENARPSHGLCNLKKGAG